MIIINFDKVLKDVNFVGFYFVIIKVFNIEGNMEFIILVLIKYKLLVIIVDVEYIYLVGDKVNVI